MVRSIFGALFVAVFAVSAYAEPATYESVVAPTFSQPADGVPDGYRLYQGCDVSAGSTGTLIDGTYTSGKPYSFAGDTDTPPVLCIVAFNAAGEGPFDRVITLSASAQPPGSVVLDIEIGTCRVTTPSGVTYDCQINLSN